MGWVGLHSTHSPLPTAGAHAGRGAERVTVTIHSIQLQHTAIHHVLMVTVTSKQHAKAWCSRPNMARWWFFHLPSSIHGWAETDCTIYIIDCYFWLTTAPTRGS